MSRAIYPRARELLPDADDPAQLLEAICSDQHDFFSAPPGSKVAVLVNNMGSMSGLELPIVVRAAVGQLRARQVCLLSWTALLSMRGAS